MYCVKTLNIFDLPTFSSKIFFPLAKKGEEHTQFIQTSWFLNQFPCPYMAGSKKNWDSAVFLGEAKF